ncbi:MAG: PD-(D/E)XK nuclease family transposase [Firmicutes bacterium]|nr:PD-(D/E)XK nuclease family transposase [Bacillota bacterium]
MKQKIPKASTYLTWAEQKKKQHKSVQEYTLMDDIFMSTVLSDPLACQHVLRIIWQEPALIVREVTVQKTMPQLYGKSPRLDVTAEMPDGRIINIEVQQQPEVHYGRRLRFYTGTMVSQLLQRGIDYADLPDQVMIYISDTDIWHRNRTIYEFQMTEIYDSFQINDGLREIFVNTTVDDGSAIAQLMQYFTTTDPYDMTQGALSQKVNYYKVEQEGVRFMKSLSQQIYEDGHSNGRAEGMAKLSLKYMEKHACSLDTALDDLDIELEDRPVIIAFINKERL